MLQAYRASARWGRCLDPRRVNPTLHRQHPLAERESVHWVVHRCCGLPQACARDSGRLRGNHRVCKRLPLRCLRHAAGTPIRSFGLRFESDSEGGRVIKESASKPPSRYLPDDELPSCYARSDADAARSSDGRWRAQDTNVSDELLAHVARPGWEHIGLTGDYVWAEANRRSGSGIYAMFGYVPCLAKPARPHSVRFWKNLAW
jgi:hypothetical protein